MERPTETDKISELKDLITGWKEALEQGKRVNEGIMAQQRNPSEGIIHGSWLRGLDLRDYASEILAMLKGLKDEPEILEEAMNILKEEPGLLEILKQSSPLTQ